MHTTKLTATEYVIFLIVLVHLVLGIGSYTFDRPFFETYIAEDGYIENATALSLFLIAVVFGAGAYKSYGIKRLILALGALVFVFGSGEEISWGQRIIGFTTPVELKEVNTQGEFNLHNMQVEGVKLNKLIFSSIMYTGIFIYFLFLPFLYKYSQAFKSWPYLFVPVPKQPWGWLYLISFLLLLVVPAGKVWELQEFCFAAFLFTSVLYQQNPKFDVLLTRNAGSYTLAGQ